MNFQSVIASYFDVISTGNYSNLHQIDLNLLELAASESLTEDFLFHPLIHTFDGLVLDDADTSNHHILLRRSPFEGYILYLSHDDRSKIVFSSLVELLHAADEAKITNKPLSELHPLVSPHEMEQKALSYLVRSLVKETDDDIEIALALIPSMDLLDIELLTELAKHDDFFVAEIVGDEIAKRPFLALQQVALLCSQHPHSQAAKAGVRALQAIGL
ncbi:MAG: hypothetical protein RR061_09790 [Muribaculaceae bacterium]|uniref:Uncharacterized protein n=1 Tax=Acinetobacter tjernbergiae DSM 14971 = CIP 107465 TaxID=1120928 RepID=V2ULU8_9GAMM|nr:hypothetical protein [Acinetobacter tjernbergiae]ESK55708.1 hypothetical protein F990_01592 [Acinetobacter tjernbergiae DSM 14971 = CIP 107465]